jgi:hypothetical protein
MMMR